MAAEVNPMRIVLPFLFAAAAAFGVVSFQEPTEETPTGAPLTVYRAKERARLEKELPGNWILASFSTPGAVIDPRDVRGFATFCEGYLSLAVQARTIEEGFFGPYPEYWVYSGQHRYAIGDQLELEATCTMAFNNMNEDATLVAEPSGVMRTYRLELVDDDLTLERFDGAKFSFLRVK
jgi:hypothetical protein